MNPHVKCSILEFSGNGVLKSETPVKPSASDSFLARLTELGFVGQELAPEGWARVGRTGYLDQQVEEDFPEGKSVQLGTDEAGRSFVSFKFRRIDVLNLPSFAGYPTYVVTAFQRYDSGGPWVLGGDLGPLERIVDDAGNSVFLGAVAPHGFEILTELISSGRVTVRSWRQRPGGPVEYIYRTIELA